MSYNALILQVLVSSPSDLPDDHKEIVLRSMRLWNNTQGRFYGIHFNPTDWREGGSPAFGDYAQAVLNEQIVDDSDAGLVVFTDRLGSPTPDHSSGTAEEIDRLRQAGKDVAVLRNMCPRPPVRGASAAAQVAALEEFLSDLRSKAFVGEYQSTDQLSEAMNGVLTRIDSKYRREAEEALTPDASPAGADQPDEEAGDLGNEPIDPSLGVWPRVEVTESTESDRKGRLKTKRRWQLVLESNMDQPVQDVRYLYENSRGEHMEYFDLLGDRAEPVDIFPPRGVVRFPLVQSNQSPGSAVCVVTWKDPQGRERTTKATVRTH